MKQRPHTHFTGGTVAPKASIYAAGLPLMPLRDYAGQETHILAKLPCLGLEFLLAPIILIVMTVFRH